MKSSIIVYSFVVITSVTSVPLNKTHNDPGEVHDGKCAPCDVLNCDRDHFCKSGISYFRFCQPQQEDCNPHITPKGCLKTVSCGADNWFDKVTKQCVPWDCLTEEGKEEFRRNGECRTFKICGFGQNSEDKCTGKYWFNEDIWCPDTKEEKECYRNGIWDNENETCVYDCNKVKGCELKRGKCVVKPIDHQNNIFV